jgi:hypothetical protein
MKDLPEELNLGVFKKDKVSLYHLAFILSAESGATLSVKGIQARMLRA